MLNRLDLFGGSGAGVDAGAGRVGADVDGVGCMAADVESGPGRVGSGLGVEGLYIERPPSEDNGVVDMWERAEAPGPKKGARCAPVPGNTLLGGVGPRSSMTGFCVCIGWLAGDPWA